MRRGTTRCSPYVTIALLLCLFRCLLCGSRVLRCNVMFNSSKLLILFPTPVQLPLQVQLPWQAQVQAQVKVQV